MPIWRGPRLRVIRAQEEGFPAFYRVVWNAHAAEFSDLGAADRQHCMDAVVVVERWLHAHRIATLNVAGPRASSEPRIHAAVFALLTAIDWSSLASALHKHLLEEQA